MKTSIKTYGIHDQFSVKPQNKESLSVIVNNGVSLVVDCPSHTVRSLHNDTELICKSTQTKVDYLVITHIDNDHVGGLEQLLWWKYFWEKTKLNLITHPAIYDLLWKRLAMIFGQDRTSANKKEMKLDDYVNFIPVEYGQEIKVPDIGKIQAFERSTIHSTWMDVLAFRVDDKDGGNIWNFSADTGFDNDLLAFLSEKKGPIIHEIWAYTEGSFSHTHIQSLIREVRENIQTRLFVNHIPEVLEESIIGQITESKSPIRFASEIPKNLSI